MVATSTRNPMISLEGILHPSNNADYTYHTEVITSFQRGSTFIHKLNGCDYLCSIWDFAIGDLVKFKYHNETKVCFYTITESDFMKGGKL